MLRASIYTIYVDLPGSEEMLLIHGYTGAYDRVSRRVASYIRSLEVVKPPKPLFGEWTPELTLDGVVSEPSEQTIGVLKKRGYLTELGVDEEVERFSRFVELYHNASQRTPSYIFMPTYDCNLRCSYCFQDHMRTNPAYRHLLRTMRRDLVDRIFEAMPTIERQHGLEPVERPARNIGFFGGEPLLQQNRPIVEYIIRKARETSQTQFWAVSNATDLHAYADLLGPDGIGSVQITLDGPPEEHDQRRIYADGSGSFARIARNIAMALERQVYVNVRLNIDRNNIALLPALAREMQAQGWCASPFFSVYSAPIAPSNDKTDRRTTMSSWELDQQLNQLREVYPEMKIIGRPDERLVLAAHAIFGSRSKPNVRTSFCGAHSAMYIFDVFGDIYACWERTGDARIRIGHVTEEADVVLEEAVNRMWRSRTVTTNAVCRKCRYALHCGGGCAVLAESQRGEFFSNHCDGFAARFRASVAEAYVEHINGVVPERSSDRVCDL
ncbi:MAG TPA: radical SAM protein [Roseiflexaceae bacterium]|nr:radical SAM protein [Roseiflexaceae bacterium]